MHFTELVELHSTTSAHWDAFVASNHKLEACKREFFRRLRADIAAVVLPVGWAAGVTTYAAGEMIFSNFPDIGRPTTPLNPARLCVAVEPTKGTTPPLSNDAAYLVAVDDARWKNVFARGHPFYDGFELSPQQFVALFSQISNTYGVMIVASGP